MVMQSFLYVILKAICTFLNQLFKRGDTCNSPQVKKLLCWFEMKDLELFAPIAFNKNGREFNKNLKAMTKVTKAQLPK
jgi:hypothetical protein